MPFDHKLFSNALASGETATATDLVCTMLAHGTVDELGTTNDAIYKLMRADGEPDLTRLFDACFSGAANAPYRYWCVYSAIPREKRADQVAKALASVQDKQKLAEIAVALTYVATPTLFEILDGDVELLANEGNQLFFYTRFFAVGAIQFFPGRFIESAAKAHRSPRARSPRA